MIEIFCPYIIVKGKKIYPKNVDVFHFFVTEEEHKEYLAKKQQESVSELQ
jgi:peptide methionine sulfoxide reductase MsrA